MLRHTLILSAALLAFAPVAEAQGKGKGKGKGQGYGHTVQMNHPGGGGCPPGLAKKNPPCVPPGLAKNLAPVTGTRYGDDGYGDGDRVTVIDGGDTVTIIENGTVHIYEPGEVIVGDYVVITDPYYYGLDPAHDYYRVDDMIYRVDEDTREVLAFIGALSDLIN